MKQLTHIFLLTLLSLLIGTFSASAQFVDVQGKYVKIWSNSTVDSTRSLLLYNSSLNVSDTIMNVQSRLVNDTLREVSNSCESKNIKRIENQKTIGEFYDRLQMLCELLKNNMRLVLQMTLGLLMLICFVVTIVGLMMTNEEKLKVRRKQILLIVCIVFIATYSNSHWAYLALVILCALGILGFNNRLLTQLRYILKDIAGKSEREETTNEDIDSKEAKEEKELLQMDNENTSSEGTKKNDRILSSSQQEKLRKENREVKKIAIEYLKKHYPALQKSITYRTQLVGRFTFDCYVDDGENVLLIEIKYNPRPVIIHDLSRLYQSASLLNRYSRRKHQLLLFIVTNNVTNKQKLLKYYNEQLCDDNYIRVKVFTKNELKTI